jgi:hypothetical protein
VANRSLDWLDRDHQEYKTAGLKARKEEMPWLAPYL